jgi:hypothetical protein
MSFLSSFISFCAGVPESSPDWDQVTSQGKTSNKERLSLRRKRESDQAINLLRKAFPKFVNQLKNDVLNYGASSIEIYYCELITKSGPEINEELKRLCDYWNVELTYHYPRYHMSPKKTIK